MAQIFRPRTNVFAKVSIFGALFFLLALLLILFLFNRSRYVTGVGVPIEQPVPFSHALHVSSLQIDCRYCHTSVEVSGYAGIPSTETCMTCHSQIQVNSPNLAPVRESWETGKPIEWNRVHDLPDYAYFNHSIHVAKGVGCVTCHGKVAEMSQVYKVADLSMGWCLGCHRAPENFLRPREEVFNADWAPSEDQVVLGRRLVQEYGIQVDQLTNCTICHR